MPVSGRGCSWNNKGGSVPTGISRVMNEEMETELRDQTRFLLLLPLRTSSLSVTSAVAVLLLLLLRGREGGVGFHSDRHCTA